ncbi:MAG: hypothetical protein RLZZ252_809, partial [Bacteroidota bacterium]
MLGAGTAVGVLGAPAFSGAGAAFNGEVGVALPVMVGACPEVDVGAGAALEVGAVRPPID